MAAKKNHPNPDRDQGRQEREERQKREEPIVRDKRRVDPVTGKVRHPDDAPASAGTEGGPQNAVPSATSKTGADSGNENSKKGSETEAVDGLIEAEGPDVETTLTDADLSFLSRQSAAEDLAAERLADLQRVTAEYANYRKRTEANRELERERSVGETVRALLPVLDDLDRAEKHGDLVEGEAFATIAQKLRFSVTRLGLVPFGAVGDPFDPQLHEAVFQQPSADADTETIADVVETGYHLGAVLLRPAKVVVAVPNG
ncbi:MAG: nucleotide exchange factor GrpE [Microbacteriaceae bacterium]